VLNWDERRHAKSAVNWGRIEADAGRNLHLPLNCGKHYESGRVTLSSVPADNAVGAKIRANVDRFRCSTVSQRR